MTGRSAIRELAVSVMARRRLLDEAREHYDAADYDSTIRAILRVLEHVQATDESVVQLHHECVSMTELCRKAIESEALRRPLVVALESNSTEGDVKR